MMDRLKEYIEKDEIYQDYKKDKLMNASDFDKFCIQHCKDIEELLEENEELKKHLKVPETCGLKTLEDYKSYYEDATKEQILADTYIDYCAYVNLAHRYSELKKQLEEVEFIVGLRQKRNLIHKFDKEYDEEDKKKNPNRDYAGIMPDAEEVYRRYYTMKNQQKEFIKYLKDMLDDENDIFSVVRVKDVLQKYKEIVGETNDTK